MSLQTPSRTPTIVTAGLLEAEDRLLSALDSARQQIPDGVRLLNELERTIEDVADPQLYQRLRRLLDCLDREREAIVDAAGRVDVHRSLDPIRIALRDVEAGFR